MLLQQECLAKVLLCKVRSCSQLEKLSSLPK
uniref:Uncharacterized protein n=1 Tax=Arundo donax TaxID=35708 RepID=A0A0A9AR46_ARUDO